MSKKTLNAANLQSLGADRLAALLMEVSTGSAEIKRRLRLELSHNLGPQELAADVRKRLASLRTARTRVSWRNRKALVRDLQVQADMITDKIAADDPSEAYALLWQFIELAPAVFARVDDSRGEVSDVFTTALARFADIAPRAQPDPQALADRAWEVLRDDTLQIAHDLVPHLAGALGAPGLAHLKARVNADITGPHPEEHEAIRFLRDLRGAGRESPMQRRGRRVLQQIADVQGDVDGYIAQFSAGQLLHPLVAAAAATRLLDAGRGAEALLMLEEVGEDGPQYPDWDSTLEQTLLAMGDTARLQAHRWAQFEAHLSVPHLRAHIAALPDFDDIDAEDRARAYAAEFGDVTQALAFFIGWPDLPGAARLIEVRGAALDPEQSDLMDRAAELLSPRFPLAALLLRRLVVQFELTYARSIRYAAAAAHLADCAASEPGIEDLQGAPDHAAWMGELRHRFGRRSTFWALVTGGQRN